MAPSENEFDTPALGEEQKFVNQSEKPELGEGTHGAGPFRAVLYSNSCAANLWHGHLTYL